MSTLAAEFLLEYVFKNWESMTHGVQASSSPRPRSSASTSTTTGFFTFSP